MVHSEAEQALNEAAARRHRFVPQLNHLSIEIVKNVSLLKCLPTKELHNCGLLDLT